MRIYMNQKEVAARIGVVPETIRNWVRAGQFLKPMKMGGSRRLHWNRAELENWLRLKSLEGMNGTLIGNGTKSARMVRAVSKR
jgi:predicted DNA-binding transcriptional regulator AlpA